MHQCVKLFYFGMTLYLFRTVYNNQTDIAVCLLASRQQYLYDKCLLLYVQS